MTDQGKFSYQGADSGGYNGTGKEWTLKRELEDADMMM